MFAPPWLSDLGLAIVSAENIAWARLLLCLAVSPAADGFYFCFCFLFCFFRSDLDSAFFFLASLKDFLSLCDISICFSMWSFHQDFLNEESGFPRSHNKGSCEIFFLKLRPGTGGCCSQHFIKPVTGPGRIQGEGYYPRVWLLRVLNSGRHESLESSSIPSLHKDSPVFLSFSRPPNILSHQCFKLSPEV